MGHTDPRGWGIANRQHIGFGHAGLPRGRSDKRAVVAATHPREAPVWMKHEARVADNAHLDRPELLWLDLFEQIRLPRSILHQRKLLQQILDERRGPASVNSVQRHAKRKAKLRPSRGARANRERSSAARMPRAR